MILLTKNNLIANATLVFTHGWYVEADIDLDIIIHFKFDMHVKVIGYKCV